MNLIEAVQSVWRNYSNFSTRACRSEYWWWTLVNFSIVFILLFLFGSIAGGYLYLIYFLITLIPTLAVTVRRHHDGNRSGWWILLAFVPYVGQLILFIFYCLKGTDGPNDYGPDPLNPDGNAANIFE